MARTVNAMLTVNSCPCITKVKNATQATRIGLKVHSNANKIEFIRAVSSHQSHKQTSLKNVTHI